MFLKDTTVHLGRLRSKTRLTDQGIVDGRQRKPLEFLARMTARSLDADACLLFIHDPGGRRFWLKAGGDTSGRSVELPLRHCIAGKVIESGDPVIANSFVSQDGSPEKLEEAAILDAESLVCVPVRSRNRGGEIVGVIEVINKRGHRGFDEEDRVLLEEASEHVQELMDSSFLDQNVFGHTKALVDVARRTCVGVCLVVFAGMLAVFLLRGAYTLLPGLLD